MCSRRNQHPSTQALKLPDVSHEKAVQKNCGSRRVDCDLHCRRHIRKRSRGGLLHGHSNDFLLSGLDKNSRCEVLVAVLAHANCVYEKKKNFFFFFFYFFKISYVLSV